MAGSEEIHVKLREYKQLLDDGIINKDEFNDLKKSVLDNLNTPILEKNDNKSVNVKTGEDNIPSHSEQSQFIDRSTNPVIESKPMSEKDKNTLFIVLGYLCAAIAVLLIPVVFGAGGVIFGYLLTRKSKTQTNGVIIIIVNIAATIIGMLLGYALW
ncbi:hypothetical protein ARA02_09555 (plasmid) [Leuconostoc mesenteroides subsp. jonggajibkimchii]|uniref:SHOCT domain-containing protein n=1 Tax=Leuconostoc mesenteroides TaxID=1245 RepID=UPI000904065A|nr:SHOCT domain-containing protein [Leuconostoc mesenteroides]APE77573.1 hypothetical protein ARA02_09555 [Leuconostoc mesenteroides subsp. jonggajibkimchii]